MEIPVELVALNCIRCGTPIPAEIEEVAWVCQQCEKGQQLGEAGLLPRCGRRRRRKSGSTRLTR